MLARLGGDEFAIILPDLASGGKADALARRVCEAMERCFAVNQHQIQSGVSVGIAVGPADGVGADDILIVADLALYAAKTKSRGTSLRYHRSMSAGLFERRQLEDELRAALAAGALELHHQPSLMVKTGRAASFEALARWQHPTRGAVSPAPLIAVAEGMRPDPRARHVGLDAGLRRGRHLAGRDQGGGEPVTHSVRRGGPRRHRARRAARHRPADRPPRTGDHRADAAGGRGAHVGDPAKPERAGREHRARGFRHRLLIAELPQQLPPSTGSRSTGASSPD